MKKIIASLQKNESVTQVAEAFGVNKGSIYALIHSRGYDLYSLKHHLPAPKDKIKKYEMYQKTKSEKKELRLKEIQERREKNLAIQKKQKAERTARLIRLAGLWRQGLTCREIGELEGGLTRSRISQLLEKYNKEFPETPVLQNKQKPIKNSSRKTSMTARGKIIFEYRQNNKKYVEIGKILGLSPTLIKISLVHYCEQKNIPLPRSEPNSQTIKTPNKPKNSEIKTIITARKNGTPLRDLANKFGISPQAIATICGEQNIDKEQKNNKPAKKLNSKNKKAQKK
ncbi:MAG: hypothetical protein LBJ00_00065 [Planctomycetaceae bacterium]|nr:hypothetical protein [Planctomycetaceae bacterium]